MQLTRTPESSQLTAFGYDEPTSTLEIHFRSTRTVYRYADVPKPVYDGLVAAESKGSYFIRFIKRAPYRYHMVKGIVAVG